MAGCTFVVSILMIPFPCYINTFFLSGWRGVMAGKLSLSYRCSMCLYEMGFCIQECNMSNKTVEK